MENSRVYSFLISSRLTSCASSDKIYKKGDFRCEASIHNNRYSCEWSQILFLPPFSGGCFSNEIPFLGVGRSNKMSLGYQ